MTKFLIKHKKALVLLLVVLVLALVTLFLVPVKNFFYLFSEPIQKVFYRAGERVSDFLEMILKAQSLKTENETLFQENRALKSQIASLKELESENQALRKVLGLAMEKEFDLALASLVFKDSFEEIILIDKGFKHGLGKEMTVVTSQKAIVGRVIEVFPDYSKVMLIFHPKSVLPAKTLESQVTGVLKGAGDSQVVFELIPQKSEVKTREIVVALGSEGIFPKGFLLGEIEEIEKSDLAPYQKAKIRPAFDNKNLENLFVILKEKLVPESKP